MRQIGNEIKKAVLSQIDTISENTRAELKHADELEAAGYRDEADLIRMKIYLSNELTAISTISGVSGLVNSSLKNVGKLALKEGVLSNKEVNIEWGNNSGSYLSDLLPREHAKDFILPTGRQSLDPTTLSFSQGSVSYGKVGKDYTFDTLVESMKKDGWKGDPIDVVNMSDGAPTSLDNTRVLAARQAGVKVEATVHNYNDKLTASEAERFEYNGKTPKTWGEAALLRIQRQNIMKGTEKNWGVKNPNGSLFDPNVIQSK